MTEMTSHELHDFAGQALDVVADCREFLARAAWSLGGGLFGGGVCVGFLRHDFSCSIGGGYRFSRSGLLSRAKSNALYPCEDSLPNGRLWLCWYRSGCVERFGGGGEGIVKRSISFDAPDQRLPIIVD